VKPLTGSFSHEGADCRVPSSRYPASAKSTAGCSPNQTRLEFELSYCSGDHRCDGGHDGVPELPGHGSPGPGCGDRIQYRACSSCGHQFWVERSCMMRECPRCYEKWAFREARSAAWRLWTGSKRRCRERGWSWSRCRVVHAVVSIPDSGQGIESARNCAYEVARCHRLDGGLAVPHPFRQDQATGEYRLDGYIHFHLVAFAYGDILPGGTDGDIFFSVLPDAEFCDYRGFRGSVGIRRCLMYLLSHSGIYEGRHAVTWWGSMSYNRLPNGELRRLYPQAWEELHALPDVRCPRCGSRHTVEILEDGSIDPGGAARHCRGGHRTRGEMLDAHAQGF